MTVGFLDEEGRECMLELGSFNGEIAPDMMIPGLQNGEEPLAAAYRSAFCVLAAEAPQPEWYELEYSGGSSVIALDQELDGSGTWRIPILLMRSGITDPEQAEYGALEVTRNPDDSLSVLGYAQETRIPQPAIPIDNNSLDGSHIILTGIAHYGEGDELSVNLCEPIALTEDAGRGLSIVRKPLSQIPGVDAGRVSATGTVKDIYDYQYDITEKLKEADQKAETGEYRADLASSDVTVCVSDETDNDETQEPDVDVSVIYGAQTLKRGTDFEAFSLLDPDTGDRYVAVFGIGRYCGLNVKTITSAAG